MRRPCPGAWAGAWPPMPDESIRCACLPSLRFFHLDQVANLEHHAPNLGRVVVLDDVLEPAQSQRPNGRLLILLVTAGALDPADAEFTRHRALSSSFRTSLRA